MFEIHARELRATFLRNHSVRHYNVRRHSVRHYNVRPSKAPQRRRKGH